MLRPVRIASIPLLLLAPLLVVAQRPVRPAAPNGPALTNRAALLAQARSPSQGTLVLTPTTLLFNASNPALQPTVTATTPVQAYVTITNGRRRAAWTLQISAQGPDLVAGGATIPVSAVAWSASGSVLSGDGTISAQGGSTPLATTAVIAAQGLEGRASPFEALVTCNFSFQDSWNYVPGAYTQTLLFTLAAP